MADKQTIPCEGCGCQIPDLPYPDKALCDPCDAKENPKESLTDEQTDRQDLVDNAIFQACCEVAGHEMNWDIEMIGAIRDTMENWIVPDEIETSMKFNPFIPKEDDGDTLMPVIQGTYQTQWTSGETIETSAVLDAEGMLEIENSGQSPTGSCFEALFFDDEEDEHCVCMICHEAILKCSMDNSEIFQTNLEEYSYCPNPDCDFTTEGE